MISSWGGRSRLPDFVGKQEFLRIKSVAQTLDDLLLFIYLFLLLFDLRLMLVDGID